MIIFTQFYTPDSQKGYVLVPMAYYRLAHEDSYWYTFLNPEWYSGIYYNCKGNEGTTHSEEWDAESTLIAAKIYNSQEVNTIAQKVIATGMLPSEAEGVLFPAGRILFILHGG